MNILAFLLHTLLDLGDEACRLPPSLMGGRLSILMLSCGQPLRTDK
ncbi:hypothetical protein SCARR_00399 [Pontiella sulfatireligans]|uniref:Uncharacterized protein n=1 Tax=Pontiella sulfatireligans TaxID=2750658 RepID=A0A6C2UFP4_9BACT|nr:hypothetical protein SCARR_00399 [Pontiella sulfatireligans]